MEKTVLEKPNIAGKTGYIRYRHGAQRNGPL